MRILHLEDSINDASLIEDMLLAEWPLARITRVVASDEFGAALAENDFDLILSDFSLPGFEGTAALDLARERCPDKPFIFLSGTIGEERAIEALQRGAFDYVLKDRPARLVPAIKQAMARAAETARRLRAEQALRESQQRFQQLAEQSSEIFWFSSLNPEGILYVSPAVERIWGRPAEDFYKNPSLWQDPSLWLAGVHPEDRARVKVAFEAWVGGKNSRFEEEYRVVRPDGSISWLLDSGTLIRARDGQVYRLSGIAKDITARRDAEDQLREQAALLDKARDAIIATDLDRRIAYWNASAERIYGWEASDVFGRNLQSLELGHVPARFAMACNEVVSKGEWRGAFSLCAKDGRSVQIETTWSLVRDASGAPVSILMIDSDVTEKKLMESQVLRADRMDSIGMLAGGVAHDLNNVLSPILMGAGVLRMNVRDAGMGRIIESIERSALHGAALVKQLLTFARGGDGVRQEVNLAELIDDVHTILRQSLPMRIEISINVALDIHPIHADGTQIKQTLLNLGINARDAMPANGRLDLKAGNILVDEDFARRHPGAQAGPHVRVSVTDTGMGIPAALIEKIFDPFFTTKGMGKGTGLGLSTVLGIVKSHGGFVTVRSEEGRGTEFALYLPAMLAPPPPSALSANPFLPLGRDERVLVVDDEEPMREALRLVLEQSGYRVVVASDGAHGLEAFDRQPDEIAALVTDLAMPSLSGDRLIVAIRERRPRLPVVAISGFVKPSVERALSELDPAVPILAKPVSSETLLAALERALAESRGTRR